MLNAASRAEIRRHCDALIAAAVVRPYGIAWGSAPDSDIRHPLPAEVCFAPAYTPAIGLALLKAGQLLDEPRYITAALDTARGLASAQEPTGRFPALAKFGRSAAGHDAPSAIADRSTTRACFAFLLATIEAGQADARIKGTALRAGQWLLKQQGRSGSWSSVFPPEAPIGKGTSLIRLDTPDYERSTAALLLGYETLGMPQYRIAALRAADRLVLMRLTREDCKSAPGLWPGARTGDGAWTELDEFPAGIDVLSCRRSMRTLLAEYVLLGDDKHLEALIMARDSLASLPRTGWTFRRFFEIWKSDIVRSRSVEDAAAAATQSAFAPRQDIGDAYVIGGYGIAPLMADIERITTLKRGGFVEQMPIPWTEQAEWMLVGFSDEWMTHNPIDIAPDTGASGGEGQARDLTTHALDVASLLVRGEVPVRQ